MTNSIASSTTRLATSRSLSSANLVESLFHAVFSRGDSPPQNPPPRLNDPKSPSSLKTEKTAFFLYLERVENQLHQLHGEVTAARPHIETVVNGITTLVTHDREWIAGGFRAGKLYSGSAANIQQIKLWLAELLENIPDSDPERWEKQVGVERREFEKNIIGVISDMDERLVNLEAYVTGVENKGANLDKRGIFQEAENKDVMKRIRALRQTIPKVKGELEALKSMTKPLAIVSLV